MPTIFSHPAPMLALALAVGSRGSPVPLLLFGMVCTILPDADVLGFRFGISYGNVLGHRGISHSLAFALTAGVAGAIGAPLLRSGRMKAFCVGFFAGVSHTVLDAMTSGGLGVAALWPFDQGRHFLPWRPISVSPIGPRSFFTQRGVEVLLSELRWVWLPCLLAGCPAFAVRHILNRKNRNA